jgi:hypothetical protein
MRSNALSTPVAGQKASGPYPRESDASSPTDYPVRNRYAGAICRKGQSQTTTLIAEFIDSGFTEDTTM